MSNNVRKCKFYFWKVNQTRCKPLPNYLHHIWTWTQTRRTVPKDTDRQTIRDRTTFRLTFYRRTVFRLQIFVRFFFVSQFFVCTYFRSCIFSSNKFFRPCIFSFVHFFVRVFFSSVHIFVCAFFFRLWIFVGHIFIGTFLFRLHFFSSVRSCIFLLYMFSSSQWGKMKTAILGRERSRTVSNKQNRDFMHFLQCPMRHFCIVDLVWSHL